MCGAYSVLTALFVVTSSQIAAEPGHPPLIYDHDVTTAGNAGVQSLPNQFLRGCRGVHDDLANEERLVYSVLANMINEGVQKLPRVAEIIEKKPRAPKAVKKTPYAADPANNAHPQPEVVEKMLYAAEAMKEMGKSKEYEELKVAAEGADEALQKHWKPSGRNVQIGDASRDISGNEILSIKEWKVSFHGMRPIVVSDKHTDDIERVHAAFAKLFDDNVKPTRAETSSIWGMLDWRIEKSPIHNHRQALEIQAQRYVLMAMRNLKKNHIVWKQWETLPESVRFGVLNYLLNLHYQRWVRMYNIFKRFQPDQNVVSANLDINPAGNTGTSSTMARHAHSKVQSSHSTEPLNGASTSTSTRAVASKRSKRTLDGNIDKISRPSKRLKNRGPKTALPLSTESTTVGNHFVSAKRSSSSFDGPSRFFAPYKPGDHSSLTSNSILSLGGPWRSFVPHQHPNVHSSQSFAPPSTALALKDVNTDLSLGGIYDRSTYEAPSVP